MKKLQFLLLSSLIVAQSLTAATADDFYLVRLRAGEDAFRRGQALEAVDELRIACFGLMEQPPLLTEGIVHLALTQAKLGRTADVATTLLRFAEVERKFGALGSAQLEPATRKDFVTLAKARLSPEVARSLPGLNQTPPPPPLSPAGREELKAQLERDVLEKQWKKAAAIVPRLEPFVAGEEVSSFYAAVSAFEAGDVAKAKVLAKPAVGRVLGSPFVDYYLRRILDDPEKAVVGGSIR